jgi:squalene synthase HpnC
MTVSAELRSGKTSCDENFPVASWIIRKKHRPVIRAFYEFVRVADDIADHPGLAAQEKLTCLDRLEASLSGETDIEPQGVRLRGHLLVRKLTNRHALDLLRAFRQDIGKLRYDNWDELIAYCTLSAMPVGRFVLDVHGEPRSTWPKSDALCAALQIINHLQDCAADYRRLNRVYLPLSLFAANGLTVEALGAPRASPRLLLCIRALAEQTAALLQQSTGLAAQIHNARLATEVSAIQTLAARLIKILQRRDPLSEPVHLTRTSLLWTGAHGALREFLRRLRFGARLLERQQAHEY